MADRRTIAQHVAEVAPERTQPAVPDDVHYPDSDGHFLPDNPLQAHAVVNLRFALHQHFEKVQNVVLEGDMFLYYEEGNPAASIAPDIYVVLNHDLGKRSVYKFWEEGKPPDFALEVISPSSKLRNSQDKRALYARLGIGEYFLFQPDPEERGQRLVGYRLWDQGYDELPAEQDGAVCSKALGVSLRVEGANLRLRSLATGRDYPWMEEHSRIVEAAEARADAAQARADTEAETRRQLEMRNAELEALLRQRG